MPIITKPFGDFVNNVDVADALKVNGQMNTMYNAVNGNLDSANVPFLAASSRSAFRAYQSVAQTPTAATFTKVLFQTKSYDQQTEFDTTLSRFTAKAAGLYVVSACVQYNGQTAGNLHQTVVYVNGVIHSKLTGDSIGVTGSTIDGGATILNLNANDYVEIYTYVSTAIVMIASSDGTYFTMCRIV